MHVKSRIDFDSEADKVNYLKSKLKDLAHNH